MDETDRELSSILRRVYEAAQQSKDRRERDGYIRRSTFLSAAGAVLPRGRDLRTKASRWEAAHDRGYLTHGTKHQDLAGPVILFAGDAGTDWERSHVRADVWAREGRLEEPLEELVQLLDATDCIEVVR